jgi:uncharacterized protein YkwD
MRRIALVVRAFVPAAVLAFLGGCGGTFLDTGTTDAGVGVGASVNRGNLSTADGEITRTTGLATDGEIPQSPGAWPPKWGIDISFPPSITTPGFKGLPGHGTVTETKWSQLEKDIVWEINKFRADPVGWCNKNGLPMLDGITAHQEFVENVNGRDYSFPAQPLYPSQGLHKAALHQTLFGNVAHTDISTVSVYVSFSAYGENAASYGIYNQASGGTTIAAKIVNEMIRDRGASPYAAPAANKGHRVNTAKPNFDRIGVACYNNVMLFQFGSGIMEKNPQPSY